MKKFIIAIAALTLSSCGDILDISPTTSVTDDAVWQDAALIGAYHTELYNAIQHGFRSWNNWQAKAVDEVFPAVSWGPNMFQHGTLSPDNVDGTLYYWDHGYQYLRKINVFLQKMDETTLDLPNKTRLVAEAKFLKAWIYFVLTTRFGSAVLLDETWSVSEATAVRFTRNTFEECVAEIEQLIAEAKPDLPKTYTNTDAGFGRATQDVCEALLARMYLYFASPLYNSTNDQSKWQKAADAARAFMTSTGTLAGNAGTYALYPDYRELFILPTGVANSEYIFGRNFTTTNGHNHPMDNLNRRWGGYGGWFGAGGPSLNLVDDYDMQSTGLPPFRWTGDNTKEVDPASGYDPQNPYNDRDPRMDASIIHNGTVYRGALHEMWIASDDKTWGFDHSKQSDDNPRSNHVQKKFMPDEDQAIGWQETMTTPWPIFRLAEIYLNYAEAMFELGDEAACREYINLVRARADMPGLPATVTGEALRARLYNERRIELAFEEHRYIDVRRWKIAMVTENRHIYGMRIVKDVATGQLTYTPELLLDKEGHFDERMYLLPIRTEEINKNKPDDNSPSTLQQTWTWQ